MKIITSYPRLCLTCLGTKMMQNHGFDPNVTGSETHVPCIVCNGTGTIYVTETADAQKIEERFDRLEAKLDRIFGSHKLINRAWQEMKV